MSYTIPLHLKEHWDRAIAFIAFNDEPGELNFQSIRGYVSTIAIAETFNVNSEKVARAVLRLRRQELEKKA